ncbi:MAG: SCP2 sterol-binding domain-containing protein [Rhodoblastus sp.]|nr:SCP2 sterol-binding domain-containing protein [Rhodoblastus sp.]
MADPVSVMRRLLRHAPAPLQGRLLERAVNQLLRGQPLAARLDELAGKCFRLCVDDVPLALSFEVVAGGLRRTTRAPHVTIRGTLQDFVDLARRREDPDTLFFQRRLAVEGETETGLHLKNLLDGWEYDLPGHLRAVLPGPVAGLTLHGLSLLRRAGSRHSSRPAAKAPGTWQLRP